MASFTPIRTSMAAAVLTLLCATVQAQEPVAPPPAAAPAPKPAAPAQPKPAQVTAVPAPAHAPVAAVPPAAPPTSAPTTVAPVPATAPAEHPSGLPHPAPNVDLKKVIPESELQPQPVTETAPVTPAPAAAPPPAAAEAAPIVDNPALVLLGSEVAPGTAARLAWSPSESFAGIAAPTPVLVVNGARPGKVLCLTAAVHGDELNGIEVVRRLMYDIDPTKLSGSVIGVPIVNLQGFRRNSRYLPDRRDLNRYFPGNPRGSSAARIAHSFFQEVVVHCNALVDLHTGSFHRTNLPQLRADMTRPEVSELSQGFGATVVLHSAGERHSLRAAAVRAGIPAVTLEAGEPMRLQEEVVNHGVQTIQNLLHTLGMYQRKKTWGTPEPIFYQSQWVRAAQGGILLSQVQPGQNIRKNQLLGTITDPITNARTEIRSPHDGRVLGLALNQVVMPGFAAYHIGIKTTEKHVADQAPAEADDEDGEEPRPPTASEPVPVDDPRDTIEDS